MLSDSEEEQSIYLYEEGEYEGDSGIYLSQNGVTVNSDGSYTI